MKERTIRIPVEGFVEIDLLDNGGKTLLEINALITAWKHSPTEENKKNLDDFLWGFESSIPRTLTKIEKGWEFNTKDIDNPAHL